ncbi:MAG: DUF3427 domain-containing protein, partial [Caulobacterales bacterium]
AQRSAWQSNTVFLDEIETTAMTRSYKMLVLRAMIDADAFPGTIKLPDLIEGVARLARRNPRIKDDLTVDPDDTAALKALLLRYPLKILAESGNFKIENGAFGTSFSSTADEALVGLASELVDWRLLRYLKRGGGVASPPPAPPPPSPSGNSKGSPALTLWNEYPREDIAPFFGTVFNPGAWNAGVVVIEAVRAMILLVTMDKRGMTLGATYTDRFETPARFVWHSQTQMRRGDRRGRIVSGEEPDWNVHLFFRLSKLRDGRGAPFRYAGPVRFAGWDGDAPITVKWDLSEPAPEALRPLLGLT